ncbi:hypothetical protein [Mucilaginibacter mallensis]|nr:hypothetical protein [Mucilaginibacter mallensis]
MEIVYVTTHLVMAICIISILHLCLGRETSGDEEKLPVTDRFYTRGLKLVKVIATTAYRIAIGVLISYLK